MKRFRIQLVIALVVLICGVSLMGVVYLVFNKPEVYINPGVIVTQPSPVSSPVQPIRSSSGILRDYPYSYTMSPMPYATAPKAAMQPSRGLYATSSAQVHEAGGGTGYGIATRNQLYDNHRDDLCDLCDEQPSSGSPGSAICAGDGETRQ